MECLSKELQISEYKMADLTGIKQPILQRIRTGFTKTPSRGTIKKIEQGLNITINDSDPENVTYTKNEKIHIDIKDSPASGNTNSKVHYVNNSPTFPSPPSFDVPLTKQILELQFEIKKRDTLITMYDEEFKNLNKRIVELEIENNRLKNSKNE